MTTAEGTVTCSVCRGENPAAARFCNVCGSRLVPAGERVEERKVVTALFCDLVGFTASSEGADPEDVDRMLSGYETTVRRLIESHGGVVEKFIGDAVVGVFGIPAAHEDDPERAVRAALRIATEAAKLPGVGDAPLRLRVGINTGEALVRLDVSPGTGDRFVAGDTINTASRIQSVAPEMGVAVGQATYEATRRRFDYVELPPATLKGKAEPVRVFQPTAPRSRLGTDVGLAPATQLVGRDAEFGAVRAAFHDAVDSASTRFVVVVGVPGMGKSRLVAELLAYVDAQPVLVAWRQGRCLPYGTGISFWALGEIVKAHAGILESDDAAVAVEKLDRVLPEGEERSWFRERLLPLLGIESAAGADRAEQFTAWRRFLEFVSEGRPTVLVFEDLHWADDAMLAFLEELVVHDPAVPLLVVGTARPELFARRAGFPGDGVQAIRIDLSSLGDDDAATVARSVLDGDHLAPTLLEPILDRAAGNPLFVEEFVRLLVDRGLLTASDGVLDLREGASLPIPDSISALLAARLDALPLEWKAVLGDASVLGKVFWSGALAAMSERTPEAVATALDGLVERELIRPAAASTMAGEREYVFWHVLGRDVAYAALPRTARGTRHVSAARWIEDRAGDRVEDVSDVLAHHYRAALDLARASGDDARANELQAPAFRFLSLAGERAMGLDAPTALALLEAALELAPAGAPERPIALHRYGVILKDVGRFEESIAIQEEAIAGFLGLGDTRMAGQAMLDENDPLRFLGRPVRTEEVLALLEPLGPSLPLARALQRLASGLNLNGEHTEAIEVCDRIESTLEAAPDAAPRDVSRVRMALLGVRGFALAKLGDAGGLEVMRRGVDAALQAGYGFPAIAALGNLAIAHSEHHGPLGAIDLVDEVQRIEATRGLHGLAQYALSNLVFFHYEAGRLDPALRFAEDMEAQIGDTNALELLIELRAFRMRVANLRGVASEDAVIGSLVQAVHELAWDEYVILGLSTVAAACLARGRRDDALAHLREVSQQDWTSAAMFGQRVLPDAVRTAIALGDLDLAESLGQAMATVVPFNRWAWASKGALLLEARGQLNEAAEEYTSVVAGWRALGIIPELALSLLGLGRTLVADARPDEARPILAEARGLLEALGAAPSIAEIDRLGTG